MRFFNKKKQNTVVFFKKVGEKAYLKLGEKKINPEDKTVHFQKKSFPLPPTTDTYIEKDCSVFFFDYTEEKFINFVNTDIGLSCSFLDKLLYNDILGKLIDKLREGMGSPSKMPWIMLIVGGVVGGVIGFQIGQGAF